MNIGDLVEVNFPDIGNLREVDRRVGVYSPGSHFEGKVVRTWPWLEGGHKVTLITVGLKDGGDKVVWDCHPDWVKPRRGPW